MADFRAGRFRQKPDAGSAYLQLRDSVVREPGLRRLLAHSPALPFVVQLLSPNIHLHTAAVIYKDPESEDRGLRTWHRDIGLTPDLGHAGQVRAGVKVCYCLTDFPGPRCGFTMFARGSHRLREPLGIPEGEVDPPAMVELTPRAGDAVLFENRTFHSVAPNTGDRVAKVVIFGYSYRWMRVDPNLRLPDSDYGTGHIQHNLIQGTDHGSRCHSAFPGSASGRRPCLRSGWRQGQHPQGFQNRPGVGQGPRAHPDGVAGRGRR